MSDQIPPRKILALSPSYNWSAVDILQTRKTPHWREPHLIFASGRVVISPVADAAVMALYVETVLNTHAVIGLNEFAHLEKHLLNAILISNNLKARKLYALILKIKRKP